MNLFLNCSFFCVITLILFKSDGMPIKYKKDIDNIDDDYVNQFLHKYGYDLINIHHDTREKNIKNNIYFSSVQENEEEKNKIRSLDPSII